MIDYKLHHLGILCRDPVASTRFYCDVLGHIVFGRFQHPTDYDLTFIGSSSDLMLELIGPPFYGQEKKHFDQHGAGLHHIAFAVDDVDAAFAELTANGVRPAWEPEDVLFVRHCGVFDDNGIVIEILQEKEPLAKPEIDPQANFLLHHFDIFSSNWRRTRAFYAQHFGFKSVFEYIYKSGGAFIYLADPYFDMERRQALLEIIGPPYAEAREFAFAEKFGTGIDHIGYVVQDVEKAYQRVANASSPSIRPYTDYGTTMCWVQDPDGNDLELMLPVNKTKLQDAFNNEKPYRPASD